MHEKVLTYTGIFIPSHKIIDIKSKDKADGLLFNWQYASHTAAEWIEKLDDGKIIQPSSFHPSNNSTFTHSKENWISTHFVCADGDNFKNVEFDDDGNDKNPNGIEPWTEKGCLSKKFPTLVKKAYAVGESPTSMLREPPHRRYRLIFIFDHPICSEEHFHQILIKLANEFSIIPSIERSPAQPVYGNGRKDFNFHICGNTLKLSDYPLEEIKEQKTFNIENKTKPNETLREFLDRHNIAYEPSKESNKFYVECPYKAGHASGKNGKTDAYVFGDASGWAFNCSHTSCKQAGRSTWESFKEGFGIQGKAFQKSVGSQVNADYVSDTPLYSDDDIDTDKGEDALMEFPQDLFFGVFKDYRDAHLDRVPLSDAFTFAGLKHTITSILGRKIYLDTSPVVFPNTYTMFIGRSSDSAKGNALRQSREMLKHSAPNVLTLSGLATPEGLLNQFVKPTEKVEDTDDGEITTFWGGFADGMNNPERIRYILGDMCEKESPRLAGYFGEFGSVLRKATKMNATGLLELIMQLYDAEDDNDSPTKTNRTVAEYPTFSMLAATDLRLIETVLQDAYISGGFTNRFEWYLGKSVKKRFLNKPKDQTPWNTCVQEVGKLRDKFGEGTDQIAFGITDKAYDLGQSFTDQLATHLNSETMSDTMIADSLRRTDMHVLKNALVFSVILNKPEDKTIGVEAVELAISLAEFTTHCTRLIFKDFATTINKQVEDKILNYLRKHPKSSMGVIANRTRTDIQTIEKAIDALVRTHQVVKLKGERKPLYAVIKNEVS